ncbi:MAG: hypothetical protein NVSMB52_08970 [Chloroflexota bacterium]
MMRLVRIVAVLAASALSLGAIRSNVHASDGRTQHYGPYQSTSPDGGTCGQYWATDTFDRAFKVTDNGNGTFDVREEAKHGTFVKNAGASPGACETDSHHGSTIRAGVEGKFQGYLEGTVTSSTYNPDGCSAVGANCATLQGFLGATFGPSGPATYTCNLGYANCRFSFEYAAGGQGLLYHSWKDSGTNGVTEDFRGDIADA